MLHSGYLVAGGVIVFRNLRLNDNLGIELIGNDEVGRLIKSSHAFGPFRLAEAHICPGEYALDGALKHIPDQLAH